MRINWFSPLLPARTEIANYTARLLPALRAHCEVTLWTDQPESEVAVDTFTRVRRFAPDSPWSELNEADLNVYHIGNNPMWHSTIWQLSRRQPGLVVLHEACLLHLIVGVYQQVDDWTGFWDDMVRHCGPSALEAAARCWDGMNPLDSLPERLPLTDLAIAGALGVLVHSRESFDLLRPTSIAPLACLPLPHSPRAPAPKPASVIGKYLGVSTYRLVVFGHIDWNRRLEDVLRALSTFPARHRFRLDVYGDVHDRQAILRLVGELGLEPIVRIHGFVSEATLDCALAEAHLAINLRFPTMGEASASQLRIWDHALPSLVSHAGWYAELPPDAVNFARPEHETADLHALFEAFLENPVRFAKQGLAGRSILEQCHGTEAYARALVDFAGTCRRDRARITLGHLACRAAAELVRTTGPHAAPIGFEAIADQILALQSHELPAYELACSAAAASGRAA